MKNQLIETLQITLEETLGEYTLLLEILRTMFSEDVEKFQEDYNTLYDSDIILTDFYFFDSQEVEVLNELYAWLPSDDLLDDLQYIARMHDIDIEQESCELLQEYQDNLRVNFYSEF